MRYTSYQYLDRESVDDMIHDTTNEIKNNETLSALERHHLSLIRTNLEHVLMSFEPFQEVDL